MFFIPGHQELTAIHRFSKHDRFMYLLYDVIRQRNWVTVKRRWKKFQDALNSLTSERLQAAIDAVINHRPITDATVLRDLRSIGAYEPHSYTQKLTIRAEIKGATVRLGMAAWWLTANPSDLRNPFPLVLVLAGLEFSHESTPRQA